MDDPKSPLAGGTVPPNLPIAKDSSLPVSSASPLPAVSPKPAPLSAMPSVPKREISPHSSIRTMEGDIKSAQAGQAPKGTEVKPPVFPTEVPKPAPLPAVPRPPVSAVTPPSGIKLGEAEKRVSPLPGQEKIMPFKLETKAPEIKIAPPVPPSSPLLPKQPVAPPLPPKPPVPIKPPFPPGGIAVPPKLSIFANRRIMLIGAAAIIVVLGGILYLRLGQGPEISGPTPTPAVSSTAIPTLEPVLTGLAPIFGQSVDLVVPESGPLSVFKDRAVNLSNSSPAKNVLAAAKTPGGQNHRFSQFLDRFAVTFPINLIPAVQDNDFNLILTKQTEFFDQNGNPVASPSAKMLLTPKIALAVRVIDTTEALFQLTLWEDTMKESFGDFGEFYDIFLVPTEKLPFSDNLYQGVPIRFLNFPYPDNSIDYAIVTASNGNDYLIIANSRQQMFSIIDKLLGF